MSKKRHQKILAAKSGSHTFLLSISRTGESGHEKLLLNIHDYGMKLSDKPGLAQVVASALTAIRNRRITQYCTKALGYNLKIDMI